MFTTPRLIIVATAVAMLAGCASPNPYDNQGQADGGSQGMSKTAKYGGLGALAGALAGVAGFLWAAQTGYVNPELMGFHMSAHAIMMVILGGMGNFAGAIVGAFAFEYVMHFFKDLTKHWQLLMGTFIVLVVVLAPRGLLGLVGQMTKKRGAP